MAASVQEAMQAFLQAFNAGDIEGILSHYAADAVFINEHGDEVSGVDAIRETLAFLVDMKPSLTIDKSKTVAVGDTASTISSWTMTGTGPDGAPFETKGSGYDVMRRQSDGSWKMVIDCPWGTAALA